MRVEITYKDNSEDTFTDVTYYSDLAFADDWFWVDLENGERQYMSLSAIKKIRIIKEETK